MTEWIVFLVGVIIALTIGFFWGRPKKSSASPDDRAKEKELEEENVKLKNDYSTICAKLTQLLRSILVFLANQRFVFLICFTVFYKF